ncbi:MAG: hypothetical protein H6912_05580 [Kordiimonadaceae bacterium]|nr:hypothetical protein [Kordiimonadaceae bacterium]
MNNNYLKIIIFFLSLFLFGNYAFSEEKAETCPRVEVVQDFFDKESFASMDTSFTQFSVWLLLNEDEDYGICGSTTDSYIAGTLYGKMKRIVGYVDGHTVDLKLGQWDNKNLLFVYYHSGGNQYILKIFEILERDISGEPLFVKASNMGSIEVEQHKIIVKNSERLNMNEAKITYDTYEFKDGTFTLLGSENKTIHRD